ncbi:MAG: helix-turn-helix domain-containing protein [Richelia sp. RM2_1_2]|nr:helix-turn-helix domain-containing protein [Richelia sp. RM2_1_2]
MLKQQVAEFLGCSQKTVERYVHEGKLSVRYEKTPGARGKPKAVFDEQQVIRFKQELSKPTYLSIPEVVTELSREDLLPEDKWGANFAEC